MNAVGAWWRDARGNPCFRLAALLAGAVVVLDQATKLWILHGLRLPERRFGHFDISGIFDLTYVENTGVSFGLFQGGLTSRILLTLLALVVAGFVAHWAGRLDRRVASLGAGLIVGGALGNAIDRSFYGFVVDFLDFSGLGFPWKFNVADAAINGGVACLAYDAFFVAPKEVAAAPPSPAGAGPEGRAVPGDNQTVGERPFRLEGTEAIDEERKGSGRSE